MRNEKIREIIKNLIIGLLLGVPLLVTASIRYDCHYDPGSLQFEEKDGWDFIRVKGLDVTEDVAKPMIPVDYIHLLIPQGQEAESINVIVNSSSTIEGVYRIKPSLPDKDSFTIDSTVYQSEEPYPGMRALIVKTGSFAGNRIVDIRVYPVDYYPGSGEIVFFNDLTIEVFYEPSKGGSVKQLHRTSFSARIIKRALTSIVDNDYDIPAYSYKPVNRGNLLQEKSNSSYPTYLVITADSLMDAFEPLIHWITKKGIRANAISVDSILQNYSYDPVSAIYDSAGAIRGFLLDAYESGTQWVLLGGDEEIVPVRYGTSENNDSTVMEQTPSDLYYSSLDGNWNVDGDNLYGEPIDDSVDIYPELFVGRLPCKNKEDINNWINKVIFYEKNPGNGNYDYLTRVFWTAADKDDSIDMRDFPKYIIENGSYPSYFSHDTTMLEDASGTSPKGSEVIAQMSNNYGWFNHYGHGAPDQLTVSAPGNNEGGPERDFLVSLDSCEVFHNRVHINSSRIEFGNGLDSLNNKDYYGVMYLASCYQGMYDLEHYGAPFDIYCGPSMAEAFTLLPERGGPAFLGYTRYAKALSSEVLHLKFLETLFDDSLMNIGVTEAISKTKVFPYFIHHSHTLFGCPLMPIWTNLPSYLNVSFADSILPDSIDFEVIVTSSSTPVKDAYVCLWKGDEVYRAGLSGGDGKLILPIKPITEGEMLITVTGKNFIPFEDTVIVSYSASVVEDFIKSPPFCKTKSILSVGEVLFEFYIPKTDRVKIDIYDLTGRRVKRLLNKKMSSGTHQVSWNGIILNEKYYRNGIYFYQFNYKGNILKGKFLLIK